MFEDLTAVLSNYLQTRAFAPLGRPSERHGSWEWAFHKHAGLDRFVIVALTSLPEQIGGTGSSYAVEVFGGAEDGTRFARHLIRESRLLYPTRNAEDWLKETLGAAVDMAESFKSDDLVEAYPPPHSRR